MSLEPPLLPVRTQTVTASLLGQVYPRRGTRSVEYTRSRHHNWLVSGGGRGLWRGRRLYPRHHSSKRGLQVQWYIFLKRNVCHGLNTPPGQTVTQVVPLLSRRLQSHAHHQKGFGWEVLIDFIVELLAWLLIIKTFGNHRDSWKISMWKSLHQSYRDNVGTKHPVTVCGLRLRLVVQINAWIAWNTYPRACWGHTHVIIKLKLAWLSDQWYLHLRPCLDRLSLSWAIAILRQHRDNGDVVRLAVLSKRGPL